MLKHGRKFERMRTDEPGVFVRKIPRSGDEPAYLAVEINPTDEHGNPTKKIGVIIQNLDELNAIREIISNKEIDGVFKAIEKMGSPGRSW